MGATGGGVGFQFRFLKAEAKLLVDAVAQGIDPATIQIPSGKKCTRGMVFFFLLLSIQHISPIPGNIISGSA